MYKYIIYYISLHLYINPISCHSDENQTLYKSIDQWGLKRVMPNNPENVKVTATI